MDIQTTNYSIGFGTGKQFNKLGGRFSKNKYKEGCYRKIKEVTDTYIRQIDISKPEHNTKISDVISEALDNLLTRSRKTTKRRVTD